MPLFTGLPRRGIFSESQASSREPPPLLPLQIPTEPLIGSEFRLFIGVAVLMSTLAGGLAVFSVSPAPIALTNLLLLLRALTLRYASHSEPLTSHCEDLLCTSRSLDTDIRSDAVLSKNPDGLLPKRSFLSRHRSPLLLISLFSKSLTFPHNLARGESSAHYRWSGFDGLYEVELPLFTTVRKGVSSWQLASAKRSSGKLRVWSSLLLPLAQLVLSYFYWPGSLSLAFSIRSWTCLLRHTENLKPGPVRSSALMHSEKRKPGLELLLWPFLMDCMLSTSFP